MLWRSTCWLAVLIVLSGGLTLQARAAESSQTRHLHVNGVDLFYLDQGTGAPVVFVHGSFLDFRFWEPQRQAIAQQYRFIAYNRRYHGMDPWPDDGQHYTAATHAADLADFIRELHTGPVHLVGHSYEQIPRSPRRNELPVKLVDGTLVMRHEHPACALV